ncbi:MAG: metalloregulator ArsR/SmtB family transcription factor [Ancalomicrobiaceae bacterium]|nr:metalloregulator ArsR/SmtB family transcription factor [Ancalomicrobiaceae bacterium]
MQFARFAAKNSPGAFVRVFRSRLTVDEDDQPMNVDALLEKTEKAEAFLKALANSHRLMILCELLKGERSVSAINSRLPLSQSALSQHLARLRDDGLVATRRDAQMIYYRIADESVERMIHLLWDIFCRGEGEEIDGPPGC